MRALASFAVVVAVVAAAALVSPASAQHADERVINHSNRTITMQHSYTMGNSTSYDMRTKDNVTVMGRITVLPPKGVLSYDFYLGPTANFETAHTIHGFYGTTWGEMAQSPFFNIVVSGKGPGLAYGVLSRNAQGPCAKANFYSGGFEVQLYDPDEKDSCD